MKKSNIGTNTLRAKHLATAISTNQALPTPLKAVVIGATNGIGLACARRLASAGFSVISVGRSKPDRITGVPADLDAVSPPLPVSEESTKSLPSPHEFRPCDAFSLTDIKHCMDAIVKDHGTIDALVMTQGMATIQGFTPTDEGNDQKLTLHYWSRMAAVNRLLPSLRKSEVGGGPVVLSVLSGGVHGVYKGYESDPELRETYSVKNAADAAGYYNDLFLDRLAKQDGNKNIRFVHASPGFVKTNWGTEMPRFLRGAVRCMQAMGGMKPEVCAENMCDPIIKGVAEGKDGVMERSGGRMEGLFVMDQNGKMANLTKGHTEEAMDSLWKTTARILGKVGINIDA